MQTAKDAEALRDRLKAEGKSRAEIIQALTACCLGWPYVFGASGQACTPAQRNKYAGYRPDHAAAIRSACPVLSGKAVSCDTCDWRGTLIDDCRGFTRLMLEWAGLSLYGGTVTAQWEYGPNWVAKGDIADMPRGLVCCVFRPSHTGMYVGNDTVRHCGGRKGQVVEEKLPGSPKWERFGIPAGLYKNAELEAAGVSFDPEKNIPTLRKGSSGDLVEELQVILNAKYGADLDVDGKFGAKTEAAVKAFQKSKGLTVDGICGPKTWAALGVFPSSLSLTGGGNAQDTVDPAPSTAKQIWDKLMIVCNNNPYAAAGIMGNMYAESSLIPNNLQNTGNKALSMTDEEYTAAVDSGAYTAEQFASDGYGYGLCQWTYKTRKAGLLQCAKQYGLSIGDARAQIIFLREELQKSFHATELSLRAAKSVREASDAFMLGFEKPKNQSEENQIRRAELGQAILDQFAGVGKTSDPGPMDGPVGDPAEWDDEEAADGVWIPRLKLLEMQAALSDCLGIVKNALEGEI